LYPSRTFEVYDLEKVLMQQGVEGIRHPVFITFLLHNEDRKTTMSITTDSLTLDKRYHVMEDDTNIEVESG
jgi:hypothetical protein